MDAAGVAAAGAGLLRRLLGSARDVVWLAVAVVVGFFLWPSSLGGCTTLTIVSGESMEPTYYTGDLVVSRCGPVEVGDVVVYNPPSVPGARVIHRVIGGDADAGWEIQGDNNDFVDPWRPTEQYVLGSAVLHVPRAGLYASILLSPLTWISVLVIALAVVMWPGRTPEDDERDADVDPAADGTDLALGTDPAQEAEETGAADPSVVPEPVPTGRTG